MSEILSRNTTEIAAGRKLGFDCQGKQQVAICDMPATWSALNGDTYGFGIVLRAGTRLEGLPVISNSAGAASSTLSVGLRDPVTKAAVDATALVNAASITSAQTASFGTGTKINNGQRYVLPQDCELYCTFGGANPQANQAIRVEVPYITP
jgi:hypothetical protein